MRRFILFALTAGLPLAGQQTIFNVPSADVLERGKVYGEIDGLATIHAPGAGAFAFRGVFGVGRNLEAGVSLGGLNTSGSPDPVFIPSLKWQPVSTGRFALTGGVIGQLPATGGSGAAAALFAYGHLAFRPADTTRLTFGGWAATARYAAEGRTGGALAAIEQKIGPHLTLAADWYSGGGAIGYFTPGLIWSQGRATLYAGYSLMNHSRQGDGALLELGWNF